jgi:membrane associated rhomboid family serine protease
MRINTLFIILCFIASFCDWYFKLTPDTIAYSYNNLVINHAWWTLLSAQFVHANLLHLGGNVLFMILFGYPLEKIIGRLKFAICFLCGGVLSFVLCKFFYRPDEWLVGASGAICTLIAMLMLYDPWRLSLVLVGFPMPLGVAGITYILLNFWMATRLVDAPAESLHVAYHAHIIGFVIGIVFSAFWNPDWKNKLLVCIALFLLYYAILLLIIRHFSAGMSL